MNKGFLVGNLVADAVLNQTNKGPWTKIRIAYDNPHSDKTDFFDIFFSGRNAEILAQYGEKGRLLSIEYRLGTSMLKSGEFLYKSIDLYGVDFNFLSSVKGKSNE